MSGGVDSSVVAGWLKRNGFDVIGVTFQFTPSDKSNARQTFGGCCTINDVHDARAVAHRLEIPHYVVNERDRFSDLVIKDFVDSYREGRTPNPCVRCNQYMKFSILEQYAETLEADWVATGHYARVTGSVSTKGFELRRAFDEKKDQSYVLYPLTQASLKRLWLPLGGLQKEETRRIAEELGLSTAHKPDSQEICFVTNDRYTDFLAEQGVRFEPGPIIKEGTGVVGRHHGIGAYTIGQRKGLGISSPAPLYVKSLDPRTNTVVVAGQSDLFASGCVVTDVHWIAGTPPADQLEVEVKVRSNSVPAKGRYLRRPDGTVEIEFNEPQWAVTPGQFAVWYDDDRVLGGGAIARAN